MVAISVEEVKTLWFTKSRRAQNDEDYETWIQGGVAPTLNAFDNGDVRTTVLVMRMREGKPGGGKGPLMSEDRSLTLATANDQTLFIFYGNRVDDVRMQGQVINTLQARMGTGGNNMPMVASIPIQDGRDINKEQNGLGIGDEGAPSYTLDSTGAQSVAVIPIQGTIIGRNDAAGPQGKGYGEDGDPMYTLDSVSGHGVATSTVRRLTPVECERLQGFPDDWTAGQSDSSRYKQMGNAVAVPVVEWVIGNICDIV
jgi:hypothetical protein